MATIAILSDIIIPKDGKSGSATDAKVPEFIEFIVKDILTIKYHAVRRIKWLDIQCLNRFQQTFKDASKNRIEMVEDIAHPKKLNLECSREPLFQPDERDLTASGFSLSTEMGVKDLGYVGTYLTNGLGTC
ncbi:hypothetical protein CS542_04605 [Pedobacter sp. IW39]|nr:hypothetical protein CS542_04605 [Pedobacter sp. IW39]